eukprot:scaffold9409_cov116-Isochrysis_galbana.AAC.15
MGAALAQRHQERLHRRPVLVGSARLLASLLCRLLHPREDLRPREQQLPRELALRRRHGHVDERLGLVRQRLEHLTLKPAQHEGREQLAALVDDALVNLALAEVERSVEDGRVREELRVQKVHERPQLVKIVLQRRSREQELALRFDHAQSLVQRGLLILDPVALVEDEVAPGGHLICGHNHVKARYIRQQLRAHELALALVGRVQSDHAHRRRKALELVDPRSEHRERRHYEAWPIDLTLVLEVAQKGDRLECFAQPHLVGKDSVDAAVISAQHPVEPNHLSFEAETSVCGTCPNACSCSGDSGGSSTGIAAVRLGPGRPSPSLATAISLEAAASVSSAAKSSSTSMSSSASVSTTLEAVGVARPSSTGVARPSRAVARPSATCRLRFAP